MTDRPIIFSAPMVRALLDGRKSQTRRILKPQPPSHVTSAGVISRSGEGQIDEWSWLAGDPKDCDSWSFEGEFCTRYVPGDRLWVRENWRTVGDAPLSECTGPSDIMFPATATEGELATFKWRPSIHMPRWASRLTLLVTGVKVERLQDISEEDARAEGCFVGKATGRIFNSATAMRLGGAEWANARDWFADLWETINGAEAWEANPWVVAVTFTVHHGNIDTMEMAA